MKTQQPSLILLIIPLIFNCAFLNYSYGQLTDIDFKACPKTNYKSADINKYFTSANQLSKISKQEYNLNPYHKSDINFSAGIGFPNMTGKVYWYWDFIIPHLAVGSTPFEDLPDYSTTGIGPLLFNLEFGINERGAIGVEFGYVSLDMFFNDDLLDSLGNITTYVYQISNSSISILLRYIYHFGRSEKLDQYLTFGGGYRKSNSILITDAPYFEYSYEYKQVPFCITYTYGVRYYFTDYLAAYGEIGIAKALLQAGIVCRLGTH